MKYADPDDHNFNYSKRYIGTGMTSKFDIPPNEWERSSPARRGASAYANPRLMTAMPAIRRGPLNKVKPISNEDEDELM